MSDGYFTIIGGDLDGQHRHIGEDASELHHIPKQEIPACTDVEEDCISPVWRQEKYTKRTIELVGRDRVVSLEFFGIDGWSDADCITQLLFLHSQDSAAQGGQSE